ncbi:MAG: O-antigen polymerase [Clostridiaceae bacterium]|nr:O-antigen polymerase [Clostridiaceae bacterium]
MNKLYLIALFAGIFILGILSSYLGMLPVAAVIACIVAVIMLLADYQKATIIVALFTVFEFVLRTLIGHPLISSIWDEVALLFCFGIWIYKWLRYRNQTPYRVSPLDISLISFMAVCVLLLFIAAPDFSIGVEGLRVVIQYMFWFFVVTQLLKTPDGVKRIINIVLLTALLVSLYGIYQFIVGVEIPANWVDQAEGAVRTRSFSIFTSPNMLAGYLSLLIPVSVGMFFAERNRARKTYYGAVTLCMGLSLLFTLSRSGWIFCFCAMLFYVWMKNRKLIVPMLLCMGALFILSVIFMPSVANRILYLFSPAYYASSSAGGRIYRAVKGFELFSQYPLFGMGLGQFGGSVALSHKLNNTFSMDNYYIKTAVEMGLVGLVALLVLLYNTFIHCYRALSKITDPEQKNWATGILSGLVCVILYNLTENMLEIPLLSSYFWMFAGIIMFLAHGQNNVNREPADSITSVSRAEKTE